MDWLNMELEEIMSVPERWDDIEHARKMIATLAAWTFGNTLLLNGFEESTWKADLRHAAFNVFEDEPISEYACDIWSWAWFLVNGDVDNARSYYAQLIRDWVEDVASWDDII